MKKILIVDNDSELLTKIAYELRPYNEFNIITADHTKQAARLLCMIEIDLLVTELAMPGIDGLQLLRFLKKKFPKIPAMVMADNFSRKTRLLLERMNISGLFKKPVNMDELIDGIFNELDISDTGRIHGISLASFLQLIDLERKTCTLTIKSSKKTGYIFCKDGEVIGAETGNIKGKKALYQMMFWTKATIEINDYCRKTEREIDIPLMYLLMESHRVKDETEEAYLGIQRPGMLEKRIHISKEPPDIRKRLFERGTDDHKDSLPAKENNAESISRILDLSLEVSEYAIFDEKDNIKAKRLESDALLNIIPSAFFSIGSKLNGAFGGTLKYIDIKANGRKHFTLFKHENHFIVLGLKPGYRAVDCISKIAP